MMQQRNGEVVSLFSGAGGLDVGLERAGWSVVSATDHDKHAMETLRQSKAAGIAVRGQTTAHMTDTLLVEADVRELSAADLTPSGRAADWRPDLLVGGPPCQPWSSAGHQKGLGDPRGQLIADYLRLIGEFQPRYVLFENVRGLVTAVGERRVHGEVLESIRSDLADLGYASRFATLNAADYGAAQRRVRLILIATQEHVLPQLPAPTHHKDGSNGLKPWVTLGETLDRLPRPDPSDVVRPSGMRAQELRALAPGKGLRTGGKVMANRPSGQWGYRQDSFLADLTLPSRTIRAASTPDWLRLPGEPDLRRLTWRECAALQGFPDDWQFAGTISSRFRQIGNAVQVDVAEAVGRVLLDSLQAGLPDTRPESADWPAELLRRVRYTSMEHRVNGHLRSRVKATNA